MSPAVTPALERPFEAYEGGDPFIFVSYAHADMAKVYQDLGDLQSEFQRTKGSRCRIWYDPGIHPGEMFAATIAEKIVSCVQLVVFLSPNAARSTYIFKETNLALHEKKQVLPVYLETAQGAPREEREGKFWKWAQLELGVLDALYREHWSRPEYLGRLMSFISPATLESVETEDPPVADFRREVEARLDRVGWSEPLAEELRTLADLLGLPPEVATGVMDETVKRLGLNAEFSALVDFFLAGGEIRPENWTTLRNKAAKLEIPTERWETLVQRKAVARAEVLLQSGEEEQAKRLLISCVGEVVPQTGEVRRLLQGLSAATAARPSAPAATSGAATTPEPAADGRATGEIVSTADRAITTLDHGVRIGWARVPGGMFRRGCPEDFIRYVERELGLDAGVLRKYPVRTEPIDPFWISTTPVTNVQYYEFVKASGHRYPAGWRGTTPPYPPSDGDKPVTGVNFQDCVDFAGWVGARLPTRAEHEKASRGEDGLLYPWGNKFDESRCNSGESDRDELTPVDAFPEGASPFGVMDMVGNAWEWVDGKRGELTMTVGASYRSAGEIYGAAFFDVSRPPESSERDLGFRIACTDLHRLLLPTTEVPSA